LGADLNFVIAVRYPFGHSVVDVISHILETVAPSIDMESRWGRWSLI
jgi:hypothetical protein